MGAPGQLQTPVAATRYAENVDEEAFFTKATCPWLLSPPQVILGSLARPGRCRSRRPPRRIARPVAGRAVRPTDM